MCRFKFHTAIGLIKPSSTGQGNLLENRGREYLLSLEETLLWSLLNWNILQIEEIEVRYTRLCRKFKIKPHLEEVLNRLIQRGLVRCGESESGESEESALSALYQLIGDLHIFPASFSRFSWFKTAVYLRLNGVSKALIRFPRLSKTEKQVLSIAQKSPMTTIDLIQHIQSASPSLENHSGLQLENGLQSNTLITIKDLYHSRYIIFYEKGP